MEHISEMQSWFQPFKINQINRLKCKKHTIISINIEKAFDKVQPFFIPFRIQTLSTVGREENFLNKGHLEKCTANIILKVVRLNAFL